MKNFSWLILGLFLLIGGCKEEMDMVPAITEPAAVTSQQTVRAMDGTTTKVECQVTTLNSGEIYQICKPENWNGELIIYAHGYVSEFLPLALPDEAAAYMPVFTAQGYAFATTSYSENGLAIQSGIASIVDLRKHFIKEFGAPRHIYLTGGSEGGIVTTLALERYPALFSGGLSLCGPCGDFRRQINYYADFRVLFDYYFPGVLPGDAINIPDELIRDWQTKYVPKVVQAISASPEATIKLLAAAQAPADLSNPITIGQTVLGVLWYDVFATRDAIRKLKGQPYDNTATVYAVPGASPKENAVLNAKVKRFSADKHALKNIQKYYETSGHITLPLVMAHTTGDPIIPAWHLGLYQAKVFAQGAGALFSPQLVPRYGHCTFTQFEIIASFAELVQRVTRQVPARTQQLIAQARDGRVIQ